MQSGIIDELSSYNILFNLKTVWLVDEKLIQACVWTVIKVYSIFCTNTNNQAFPVLKPSIIML